MQTIKINLNKITKEEVDLIMECLKSGKVMAYPTDTVYGLGCDARDAEAIKRINKIKGEKGKKPLLILISDFQMLKKYCFVNSMQMQYLEKVWPDLTPTLSLARRGGIGPVTVILKRRPILPGELTG
ncbi:Sua5/YciO/YrdC/YwlC family protein, partial [Candidatus Falkowbacteria bacterium]|nr:Sua5/YciO/YrdC/YwlC family protein [Candidatus Falkowbacteria bacterium]